VRLFRTKLKVTTSVVFGLGIRLSAGGRRYYEGSEDYFTHNFYGNGLDFHKEEGQYCGPYNCSELLWGAVGKESDPNYWESYSTNLFAGRAVAIVQQHAALTAQTAATTAPAPLFLYLAFQGVHERVPRFRFTPTTMPFGFFQLCRHLCSLLFE
jgi:hypothetical protein